MVLVVNTDCFRGYDPSLLGNIDPDINYPNSNNKVKYTPIIMASHFLRSLIDTDSLSMFHSNIRSIPDHFLQVT